MTVARHKAEEQIIALDDKLTQRATAIVRNRLHGTNRAKHREPGMADLRLYAMEMNDYERGTVRDAEAALERWKHDREGKD